MKYLTWIAFVSIVLILSCKKKKDDLSIATIATTAASAITANSATTGGALTDDGGSAISQRGVVWGEEPSPTAEDSVTAATTTGETWSVNLINLKPNTTYYVRAYAINASGTAYGNEISFKTAAGLATITTTAISENIALSAKSGGEITNDGGSAITARGICYAITPNPTIENFIIDGGIGTGSFTSTISTASEVTYYVRAYATNAQGTAYGNEVSFKATSSNSVMDIDGNIYGTVVIGTQTWTTSNLKVSHYNNGDAIVDGSAADFNWLAARDAGTGAFTYPERNATNEADYGRLYNNHAVNDVRGLCPAGWHVPTDDEWKVLEMHLGMSEEEANTFNWRGNIAGMLINGGNTGLNLQNAGYMFTGFLSNYVDFGVSGMYWTSSMYNAIANFTRGINVPGGPSDAVVRSNSPGSSALSIRCIKSI